MDTQTLRSPARRHRRVGRTALAVASVVALVTLAAGCVTNPPYQVSVPGTYTVDFFAPTLSYPQGGAPVAKVAVCMDTASAIGIEITGGSMERVELDWNGSTYHFPTPVLQPGCGLLRLTVTCCFVPHYVQVTLSKLPAPA